MPEALFLGERAGAGEHRPRVSPGKGDEPFADVPDHVGVALGEDGRARSGVEPGQRVAGQRRG
ncbi:hypothetical protein Misp01_68700 [Microtetraspora sp. NBRC 13810]|uniref:hypothetical protein n=1 Tax=Microtetraspora sp. NBRC 13810 TaxID=3030990 RepID=UPI0024A43DE6|nr:hypothetical protein [Microtetraspora sp. NBRC 13810]GLW11742.1 hypothetical protein Misp01_68700 [Microtetraspora sp. NBRC 13810]